MNVIDNPETRSDINIFVSGSQVEELKDVTAKEALPYLMAAAVVTSMGGKVEIQFSNEAVYEDFASHNQNPNLTITRIGA